MITVGSLFSGIGGLEYGLEQTGGFKTIWHSEIDPYANKILKKHWPGIKGMRTCSCNAGFQPGLILDPFMGSGTVALVAEENHRRWLGIELSKEYIEIAESRLAHFKHQTRL